MKLSLIVVTRNRAAALAECLNSISTAIAKAPPTDIEIVVADNGSTDGTLQTIESWAQSCASPVQTLYEARPGKARALNRAVRISRGELFATIDDDCRLQEDYISDLLRHAAADTGEVLRGGRVEPGDPADLPITLNTRNVSERWSRKLKSARSKNLPGVILGCNMTMRRNLYERIGAYDEDFGPGSRIGSGDDTDYIFRAYSAGVVIEYVPDMIVFHHHGRRTKDAAAAVMRRYAIGHGGLWAKHTRIDPFLCRMIYTNLKSALREVFTRRSSLEPVGFSHRAAISCHILGAWRYRFAPDISGETPLSTERPVQQFGATAPSR